MSRIALLVIAIALLSAACGGDDDDSAAPATTARAVTVEDASAYVDGTLLGDAWTGSGTYTIEKACKAYNATDDFTVYAARITAPGLEDGQTLFWRAGGKNPGDGLTTGDTVTRQFSDWGAAARAGSPADDQVNDARGSAEGKAVISCAEQ